MRAKEPERQDDKQHNEQKAVEILIADDNPANLKVLEEILSREGYNVRIAKDGGQVLKSLEAAPVDLLILDVHMPVVDGFEVCKRLKEKETTKHIPVIFLSALTDTFNKIQAFRAGAVDYLTKPVEYEELKLRIITYLEIRTYHQEIERLKRALTDKEAENEQLRTAVKELSGGEGLSGKGDR